MPDKQVYEYAFIRYVPRVEREEFINVGVILYSLRHNFLQVRYHIDEDKIKAFYESADIEMLTTYLRTWDIIARGDAEGGKIATLDLSNRFRWLTASRSTIIQSSHVHPGLCTDPQKVMEDLFEKYVL
jgi:hypothetical protein